MPSTKNRTKRIIYFFLDKLRQYFRKTQSKKTEKSKDPAINCSETSSPKISLATARFKYGRNIPINITNKPPRMIIVGFFKFTIYIIIYFFKPCGVHISYT